MLDEASLTQKERKEPRAHKEVEFLRGCTGVLLTLHAVSGSLPELLPRHGLCLAAVGAGGHWH